MICMTLSNELCFFLYANLHKQNIVLIPLLFCWRLESNVTIFFPINCRTSFKIIHYDHIYISPFYYACLQNTEEMLGQYQLPKPICRNGESLSCTWLATGHSPRVTRTTCEAGTNDQIIKQMHFRGYFPKIKAC